MRIKLEGVRKRRELLIDELKFGDQVDRSDDYETSYDRQASSKPNKVPIRRRTNNNKWIWQSAVAILFVLSTVFLQQLSSPWAVSSVSFINDVVERDYNWEGVMEALPFDTDFFSIEDGIAIPSTVPTDPSLHNEFAGTYPNNPETLPVFGLNPSDQQTNQPADSQSDPAVAPVVGSIRTNGGQFALPIEGLLVKKFTIDKPFIEFIALDNKGVHAVTSGIVTKVGYNDQDELLVYVESDEFTHVYGRLKDVIVKEGDKIGKSQKLATVNVTDDVELLLFQIIKDGKAIDPEVFLP